MLYNENILRIDCDVKKRFVSFDSMVKLKVMSLDVKFKFFNRLARLDADLIPHILKHEKFKYRGKSAKGDGTDKAKFFWTTVRAFLQNAMCSVTSTSRLREKGIRKNLVLQRWCSRASCGKSMLSQT